MESAPVSPPQEFRGPERNIVEDRTRALVDKFELNESIPNLDKIIDTSKTLVEKYKIPESLLEDDINMALILGCSQKMNESTDEIYLRRVDNLLKRLVAPHVSREVIDSDSLWGEEPESGGLDEERVREYVQSKVDIEATNQFKEKYAGEVSKAKEVWKAKGYDLDINVSIVSDDIYEFRRKTRAGGFVNVPDQESLPVGGGPAKVDFVLLKGYSDGDNFVRHEMFHIVDFWGFQRRGYQGSILENLDELYTEYSAKNYNEGHSKDPHADANYFVLKKFWDELSYTGDIDFNVISDREAAVDNIIRNFGFDGFVDFTLVSAHPAGRFSKFETFFADPNPVLIDMLISKSRIGLRRINNLGETSSKVEESLVLLNKLNSYIVPPADYWSPRYKSIYELIPTKEGMTFSASPDPENNNSIQLKNEDAKKAVNAYACALAYAEMYHGGEVADRELYDKTVRALGEIAYHRKKPEFDIKKYIKDERSRMKDYVISEDELNQGIYEHLYQDLVNQMEGVDFAFSLRNPDTKSQILTPFFGDLDTLAQHCIETGNKKFINWFINGLYNFNMTTELRTASVEHLSSTYPVLKPFIDAKIADFDGKKVANLSL